MKKLIFSLAMASAVLMTTVTTSCKKDNAKPVNKPTHPVTISPEDLKNAGVLGTGAAATPFEVNGTLNLGQFYKTKGTTYAIKDAPIKTTAAATIASVDANGVVTGLATGNAIITITIPATNNTAFL